MTVRCWLLAGWLVIVVALSACGKKGNPLPPFVDIPAAVGQPSVRRVGDEVVLTLALPVKNIDESIPVNVGRVEVFAYTGRTAPPATRFLEVASRVGMIERTPDGILATTLREQLTADAFVEGPPLPRLPGSTAVTTVPVIDQSRALRRYYMAVAFNERGRPGPASALADIVLTPLPDAPPDLQLTYDADAIMLTWDPSGGIIGFLLEGAPLLSASPLDDVAPSAEVIASMLTGPTRYNVYRKIPPPPDAAETKEQAPAAAPLAPVNAAPLDGFIFTDPLAIDGSRRCYAVSAVRGRTDRTVEGHPSTWACVTPLDIFPPSAPTGVSPIAVEGAISLVWEANNDSDLQGYLVWRGEEGSETLTRITDEVVKETRYTDQTVKPGTRYVYAVTAVDNRSPEPNISAESERVEITAR